LIVSFEWLLNLFTIEHEFWTFAKFDNLNGIEQNQDKRRPQKFNSYIKITECSLNTLDLEIQWTFKRLTKLNFNFSTWHIIHTVEFTITQENKI
jgi:hypothetical protein